MQYSLMDEFKAFKPADMENDDRVYEFCFINYVWFLFKSIDGGQITIE